MQTTFATTRVRTPMPPYRRHPVPVLVSARPYSDGHRNSCVFVPLLGDWGQRQPCSRDLFKACQAERYCIKHALPVFVAGAQVPLQMGARK